MSILKHLQKTFAAGQAGVVIRSDEPEACAKDFKELIERFSKQNLPVELFYWDSVDGLVNPDGQIMTAPNEDAAAEQALGLSSPKAQHVSLPESLQFMLQTIRGRVEREACGTPEASDTTLRALYVRNFNRWLGTCNQSTDKHLLELTQKVVLEGPNAKVFLFMQMDAKGELPPELVEHCEVIDLPLPSAAERSSIIEELLSDATPEMIDATSGLSRAKTAQVLAFAIAEGSPTPLTVFAKKAKHLAQAGSLDVWHPRFVPQFKLWPTPEAEELQAAQDVTAIREDTALNNPEIAQGNVRVRIRYVDQNGQRIEANLPDMSQADFDRVYRPERDFYSFKSIIGLNGLKHFLQTGLRSSVPDRARMRHVLMLGVPGTGKSFTMQCTSGQFNLPLSTMRSEKLYSKWLGETDKLLAGMLSTVEQIGGILAIDEFQRFLPQGGANGEAGGVENRMLGTLLTWFNDQRTNLILSAANNIKNLPDEVTRSGRVDALFFVGFPGREAKNAAWNMYLQRHGLSANQTLPADDYWTPADIMSCCRLAEMQNTSVASAAKLVTPSYDKNRQQMESLMEWAETAGCICAETGERFQRTKHSLGTATKAPRRKVTVAPASANN